MKSAANVIFFKIVYGLSLVGVAAGSPWWGAVGLVAFLIWNAKTSEHPQADLVLVGVAVALGTVVDTINIHTGVLVYAEHWPSNDVAPFWIMVLWANFALIMNNGLRWLHDRYFLAALIGGVFGPLGYLIGIKLDAASLGRSIPELILVTGVTWALALPFLLFLAGYLSRASLKTSPQS